MTTRLELSCTSTSLSFLFSAGANPYQNKVWPRAINLPHLFLLPSSPFFLFHLSSPLSPFVTCLFFLLCPSYSSLFFSIPFLFLSCVLFVQNLKSTADLHRSRLLCSPSACWSAFVLGLNAYWSRPKNLRKATEGTIWSNDAHSLWKHAVWMPDAVYISFIVGWIFWCKWSESGALLSLCFRFCATAKTVTRIAWSALGRESEKGNVVRKTDSLPWWLNRLQLNSALKSVAWFYINLHGFDALGFKLLIIVTATPPSTKVSLVDSCNLVYGEPNRKVDWQPVAIV